MRDKIYEIEYNCCNSLFVPEENSRCPKCRKEGPRTKILSVHTSTVAISNPKSFCFKPTFGSFDNYDNSVLLHCGISDSEGKVNHFNVNLFEGDLNGWKQCISISLSDCKDWDAALKQHHKNELELLKRNPYHSIQNNCYSYCVRFLNLIQWKEKSNWTKEEFVESLVQPQLQVFETFHYIANKITKDGYFALTKPIVAAERHYCDICTVIIPLQTNRYRCTDCQDFDLCEECYLSNHHPRSHNYCKILEGSE